MCFITVEDIDTRLRKPEYSKTLGDLIRLELPPPSDETDDTWPCVTAVLHGGRHALLWTIWPGQRDEVLQVLNQFNETLG